MKALRVVLVALLAGGAAVGGYLWQRQRVRSERLGALESRRDALRRQLDAARGPRDLLSGAPRARIALGIPSDYAADVVRAVTTRLLDRVVLHLGGIEVRREGEVRAKVLFAHVKAGTWHLDVTIQRIRAVLRPGEPVMDFGGGRDEVAVDFPVRVEEGEGSATIGFRWDSSGAANLVCRDFAVEQSASGSVVPAEYQLRGRFIVSADGDAIAVLPEFRERTIRVKVQPSRSTWAGVRQALEAQDSFWRCGVALEPAEIEAKLREIVDRGFDVRLPDSLFRPIRLPASVRGSLDVAERSVGLTVAPTDLQLTPAMLWYGADVRVELGDAATVSE